MGEGEGVSAGRWREFGGQIALLVLTREPQTPVLEKPEAAPKAGNKSSLGARGFGPVTPSLVCGLLCNKFLDFSATRVLTLKKGTDAPSCSHGGEARSFFQDEIPRPAV